VLLLTKDVTLSVQIAAENEFVAPIATESVPEGHVALIDAATQGFT